MYVQWQPPIPPILLPTKTIGMQTQGLCGGRNHRETRKKASTQNQSCLGEKAKGLRAKASRDQLIELGVSSRFFSGLPWIWSAEGRFSRPWCSSASSDHLKVHFAYSILCFFISIETLSSALQLQFFERALYWSKVPPSAMLEFDDWQFSSILSVCCLSVSLFCFPRFSLAFWFHSEVSSQKFG